MFKLISLSAVIGILAAHCVALSPAPAAPSTNGDEQFPLRTDYAECPPIETGDLLKKFDHSFIVDARNKVEYDVLHMDGATNILLGDMTKENLLEVRPLDDKRPLVFYCNGVTCSKSYKAARKAIGWGFENVHVYDAGIFEWAKLVPARSIFFERPMNNTMLKLLISKEEHEKSLVSAAEFIKLAESGGYHVYDVRDPHDMDEFAINLPGTTSLSMDLFIKELQKGNSIPKEKLLFIDNVGKQVKWLEYYLRRAGYTDYKFAKGGVLQWQTDGFNSNGQMIASADGE